MDDEVEVLEDVFDALVCDEEAEDEFEDVDELVLLFLRVVETAERKRSLNAILRVCMFFPFFFLGVSQW
jgi:hypothetical protein